MSKRKSKIALSKITDNNSSLELEEIDYESDIEEETIGTKIFNYFLYNLKIIEQRQIINILKEIYNSENIYYKQIQSLVKIRSDVSKLKLKVLCKNVEDDKKKCCHNKKKNKCTLESDTIVEMIEKEDLERIFINTISLKDVHKTIMEKLDTFFDSEFQKISSKNLILTDSIFEICEIFCVTAPYFGMYTFYIQRYEEAVMTLHRLRTESKNFDRQSYKIELEHHISLLNLLSKPVTRIAKYPLLFKELEKQVNEFILLLKEENNEEELKIYQNLSSKISIVREIIRKSVEKVNDKLEIAKEMKDMLRVEYEIGSKLPNLKLIQPWRRLKKELLLYSFDISEKTFKSSIIFLFNDLMIVCVENQKTKVLKKRTSVLKKRSSVVKRDSAFGQIRPSSTGSASGSSAVGRIRPPSTGSVVGRVRPPSSGSKVTLSRSSNRYSMFSMSFRGFGRDRETGESGLVKKTEKRNLTPVVEIRVETLVNGKILTAIVDNSQYFALCYIYQDIVGEDVEVKFHFDTKPEAEEIQNLIIKLQDEELMRRKQNKKVLKQKKGRLKQFQSSLEAYL